MRRYSSPLTPPAELVGQSVSWRPRGRDGRRSAVVVGRVESFDADARELVITVQQAVSAWQPNPERTVRVPLSQGPFTAR
jgi:hypothetical protein